MITFANPYYFILLVLPVLMVVWHFLRSRGAEAALTYASTEPLSRPVRTVRTMLVHLPMALRVLSVVAVIICLARPQTSNALREREVEGIDIILTMDISTSMLAQDFRPNRFEAAKDVACQFVSGRESDNIGFVIFAAESFTQVPMTTDKAAIVNAIQTIEMGSLEDGTAIGDGIATSINRIKEGKAKSKSIILLTDGSNNTGVVAPLTAADIAKEKGIKIYTIGVGSNGSALYPVGTNMYGRMEYQRLPVVIDEATLKNIAKTTGGKYFRATNKNVLKEVFKEIDALEKTQMDVRNFSKTEDYYMPWALLLLALVAFDILCRYTVLRRIP